MSRVFRFFAEGGVEIVSPCGQHITRLTPEDVAAWDAAREEFAQLRARLSMEPPLPVYHVEELDE